MSEASRLLVKCRNIDPAFLQFYGDDFLRLLILRFIFCRVVLRLHRLFMNNNFSPRSHPPLSEPEILEQPSLKKVIIELVSVLDVRNMFNEIEETD
ncbi:protein SCAI [Caerostris extrusa]|nr:protein SCAI [Caerostris extrusa]